MSDVMLEAEGLHRSFDVRKGPLRRVVKTFNAVEDVDLTVRRGEALGVVGESGCGKSTLARMLTTAIRPTAGDITLHGPDGPMNLARATGRNLKAARQRIQMVFQDPFSSLNPRMTVAQIVGDPLIANTDVRGKALRTAVGETLELVGLDPRLMDRFPHAFSGGQRQRIGLARALILKPEILVADEPVSALDVSVQAQILNLLERLRGELGLTYVFISHDLGVVQYLCERLVVMYSGRVVETGPTAALFDAPQHPYVESLIAAAPSLIPGTLRTQTLTAADIADPADRPAGCAFHPRCAYRTERCREERPPLSPPSQMVRRVACHHAATLELTGTKAS